MPKTEEHRAATSAQVLTGGPQAPKIDARWQKYYDRLIRLRDQLDSQRTTQVANAHSGEPVFGVNPADRGTDEYDMGAALSLISSEQDAIYEIDQAIQRIRDGRYGACEATGKPISEERLDAVPWTRFARDVEENLERERQSRKPRHAL
jgi:DnaK suppressor protein